jgi:mRNA interferase MazF
MLRCGASASGEDNVVIANAPGASEKRSAVRNVNAQHARFSSASFLTAEHCRRRHDILDQSDKAASRCVLYHDRQIRWCRLGTNVGFEQDGTGKEFSRPVLILRGLSRHVCMVVPLTTSTKENPYHFSVGAIGGREASVIFSQIRLINTRRLDKHIATIDEKILQAIQKAVKGML